MASKSPDTPTLDQSLSNMTLNAQNAMGSLLHRVPAEIRIKIWTYLLSHDYNRKPIIRRPLPDEEQDMVQQILSEELTTMLGEHDDEPGDEKAEISEPETERRKMGAERESLKGLGKEEKQEKGQDGTDKITTQNPEDAGDDEAQTLHLMKEKVLATFQKPGVMISGPHAWEHPERLPLQMAFGHGGLPREGFRTSIFRVEQSLGQEALRTFHETNLFVLVEYLDADLSSDARCPQTAIGVRGADAPGAQHHVLQLRFADIAHRNSGDAQAEFQQFVRPPVYRKRALICARYLDDFVAARLWDLIIGFRARTGQPWRPPFRLKASGPAGIYRSMGASRVKSIDMMRRVAALAGCTSSALAATATDAPLAMSLRLWDRGFDREDAAIVALGHQLRLYADRLMREGSLVEAQGLYKLVCGPLGQRVSGNALRNFMREEVLNCNVNMQILRILHPGEVAMTLKEWAPLLIGMEICGYIKTAKVPGFCRKAKHLLLLVAVSITTGRSLVGIVPYAWQEGVDVRDALGEEVWLSEVEGRWSRKVAEAVKTVELVAEAWEEELAMAGNGHGKGGIQMETRAQRMRDEVQKSHEARQRHQMLEESATGQSVG